MGSKFGTDVGKRYREGSEVMRSACFSRKKRQENGTDPEKLRRWQNSMDSSAVLFLVRKGPLGMRGDAHTKVGILWPCYRGRLGRSSQKW